MNPYGRLAIAALGIVAAQAGAQPKAHETNIDGVTAEVVEAVRKEGVLTMKVRFRNAGTAPAGMRFASSPGDVDKHYVVAGSTKMLVLKDAKGYALMPPLNTHGMLDTEVKPGGSYLFWAKYPAPPAGTNKVTFYSSLLPPIEDIPVTEAK